jgi:hypothetical protein
MRGLKLGLLYTLALAVVLWLVFFRLKPAGNLSGNLRPADGELTGVLVSGGWSAKQDFAANFALLDFLHPPEMPQSWLPQGFSVRGMLNVAATPNWQEKLADAVVPINFPVIQLQIDHNWIGDRVALNKFLAATKGATACRFMLALNENTPVNLLHLSGWDGFAARLPEAGFEPTFLAASHLKNLVRGRNLPAWFELPISENPVTLQQQLAATFLQPEITGFQFDLRHSPVTSQLLVYLNLLQQLNYVADFDYVWYTGTREIGVLLSESRVDPGFGDVSLANFTAQALLRAGMPVELVPLERGYLIEYLAPYRILFLNYQDQFPTSPVFHDVLAQWVRRGGVLIFHPGPPRTGDFWWQHQQFSSPAAHLFGALKLKPDPQSGLYKYGQGTVIVRVDPLRATAENVPQIRELARQAVLAINQEFYEFHEQNYLYLKRGPLVIAAVLENAVSELLLEIPGSFIDCGTAELAFTDKRILQPGDVAILYNLKKVERLTGKVLLSASGIRAEKDEASGFSFVSRGPIGTRCQTLVKLVALPHTVQLSTSGGRSVPYEMQWTPSEKLLRLIYENQGEAVNVQLLR